MTVPESKLRGWIQAARSGSPEDLGRLMDTCRTYLLLVANQELDNAMLAKGGASDLVQETFIKAQRGFSGFRGETEEELRGWLRQILKNHLVSFRRKYRLTRKRAAQREVSIDTVIDVNTQELALHAPEPTPADLMIQSEQMVQLRDALKRIPREYARVIVLRHRQNLSFQEIALRMNRTSAAVRKLWARAVEAIQRELKRQ